MAVREGLCQERDFRPPAVALQTGSRSSRRWRSANSLLRSAKPTTPSARIADPTLRESALDGFKSGLPPARQIGSANSPFRAGSAIGTANIDERHVEIEERRRTEALCKGRAQGQRRCRSPDQRILRIEGLARHPSSRRNDRRAPRRGRAPPEPCAASFNERQPQFAKRSNNGALVRAGEVYRRRHVVAHSLLAPLRSGCEFKSARRQRSQWASNGRDRLNRLRAKATLRRRRQQGREQRRTVGAAAPERVQRIVRI